MGTATQEKQEATEVTEHRFTKAQMRRFNELQGDVGRAQEDLKKAEDAVQGFIRYLSDEHDLDPNKQWVIGPQGFMLAPEKPNTPNEDANNGSEQGQPNGSTPAAEEGQTATPQE